MLRLKNFFWQEFKQATDAYAFASAKAGERDAAYEALRQWLAEHPEDTMLRPMLATALQSVGQPQSAIN